MRQRTARHIDIGAQTHPVIEIDDIIGSHTDAAIRCGSAESVDLGGAVDINVTAKCVAVICVRSGEPKDAADDGVTTGGVWLEHFAGGASALEYGTGWLVTSNFFCDPHTPEGCAVGTRLVAETELRCGDFVDLDWLAFAYEQHFLVADANNHFVMAVHNGTATIQERNNAKEGEKKAGDTFFHESVWIRYVGGWRFDRLGT